MPDEAPPRQAILKVLVVALGGQGGNVLRDWLTHSASAVGLVAQTTAVVGGAQRGGPTSFYIEIAHEGPTAQGATPFSLFAIPGEIDVIVAQELLELGRALEAGFGGPTTTIITSTDRVYSTLEKQPAADGIASGEEIIEFARQFSSTFLPLEPQRLASRAGLPSISLNAILLGALCASGALPIDQEAYEQGITRTGVATDLNLKAFRLGVEAASRSATKASANGQDGVSPEHARPSGMGSDPARAALPADVQDTLDVAVAQLTDYQSVDYAARYLALLTGVRDLDSAAGRWRLLRIVARTLAVRMTYEDAARVAQLKARAERLDRLRQEHGVRPGQVFRVVDYFDPHPEELYGLLPRVLATSLKRLDDAVTQRAFRGRRPSLALRVTTSSARGMAMMRLLAVPRHWRLSSWRFEQEWSLIEAWLADVRTGAGVDAAIACEVAEAGNLVKGYGDTRERTIAAYRRFREEVVAPAITLASSDADLARDLLRAGRRLTARDEAGEAEAVALAGEVMSLVRSGHRDRAAARLDLVAGIRPALRPLPMAAGAGQ